MYQIEVKAGLIRYLFQPAAGWRVTVDVDAMERGKGGTHPRGKRKIARAALKELLAFGAVQGPHKLFGRVDVIAEHDVHGLRLIEVEGDSSRQREQAMYSALGQLLLTMKLKGPDVRYGLAVPDNREWWRQLLKIPTDVRTRLRLELYVVGHNGATSIEPGAPLPDWARG